MGNYTYLLIGILLGIGISVYVYISREERIEKEIAINKRIFSTKLLDMALEKSVSKMKELISEKSRELSEDEKNEIIFDCLYSEKNLKENDKNQINSNV